MKKNKTLLLWVLVGISTAALIGVGAYSWIKSDGAKGQFSGERDTDEYRSDGGSETLQNEATDKGNLLSPNNCSGMGSVELTNYPMDVEDFKFIVPYGLMTYNHVTPIDHQYFEPTDRSLPRDTYEVYAMADAKIVEISSRESGVGGEEYRIVFMHTCTFLTYFDLVTKLTPDIESEFNSKKSGTYAIVDIDVTAGQQIGWIGGQTLDFAVWNTEMELEGFSIPSHYDSEPWKIYTADPYDYYSDEIMQTMIDKNLRTDEPISGQIDYDQEGKLIGNWFKDGTEGYGSGSEYWKGHLSISPEHLDPDAIIASFGDFNGEPRQYAVKDPTPYPTEASQDSGLVKYELYDWQYYTSSGETWDRNSLEQDLELRPTEQLAGCVAFELVGEKQLFMEIFSNSSCSSVSALTDDASIYRR